MESKAGDETRIIKVMVVDDSMTIRRTAETLLKREGYTVVTAEDGFAALPKLVDYHPDIVFLDITMPRLDGYQACAVIRSSRQFCTTPVVMLSSRDGVFDKARGKLAGSDQFVTKPFSKDDLLAVIQRYVHVSPSL